MSHLGIGHTTMWCLSGVKRQSLLCGQGPDTQLVLLDCYLHGVPHASAITMEGGRLRMQGGLARPCDMLISSLNSRPCVCTAGGW